MTSEGQRVWGAAVHVASQCKNDQDLQPEMHADAQ